ncbi:hypothetical protein L4D21_12500 [Photobacterium profundum]|uniref:hypothetical protein n=1 Tax=Photobacterium profundum TaxID=74109 RepID=UPI003D0F825B
MNKTIASLIVATTLFSGSALASVNQGLNLIVTPQKGGAWVTVEKDGAPQAGLDVTVKGGQKQHYTTSKSGRVFVYSSFEAARSMTFEVSDEDGTTVSTQRFISSNRS